MAETKIEWANKTWNPVTGCTKISPGCQNCYAERMSKRLAGRAGYPKDDPFKVTLHPDRLDEPLKWKKPSRIFVCSMGDLFHYDVPDEYISEVFDVMCQCPDHIFQVLTKRPERMSHFIKSYLGKISGHIWLGVTAENQEQADKRIPILLQIPAAVRFVSVEPMLGYVALSHVEFDRWTTMNVLEGCGITTRPGAMGQCIPNCGCEKLNWVICGGESGPGARPMHPDWARSLRDQCKVAGVPFFFKQWGEWQYVEQMSHDTYQGVDSAVNLAGHGDYNKPWKVGKKVAGRLLDGEEYSEYPKV